LEYEGIDIANWDTVKREFLATYEPRYTAKTTCTNFGELVQRSNESVNDYYLRVCEAISRICEAKPAAMNDVRTAVGAAAAAADRQEIKKEGILDAEKFFRHQLFLAGLKDALRAKVLEANRATLRESVTLAIELETIHADRRRAAAVAAVRGHPDDEVDGSLEYDEDLDEQEMAAVNALRQQQGRPMIRRPF